MCRVYYFLYCHSSTSFNPKCSMWISAGENMDTRYSAAQFSCNFLCSHRNLFEFLEIYLSANDIADFVFKCPNNLWQRGLHNDATPDTIAKMSMNIIWSVGVSHQHGCMLCMYLFVHLARKKKHVKHNHNQPDACTHKRIRSDAKMISTLANQAAGCHTLTSIG